MLNVRAIKVAAGAVLPARFSYAKDCIYSITNISKMKTGVKSHIERKEMGLKILSENSTVTCASQYEYNIFLFFNSKNIFLINCTRVEKGIKKLRGEFFATALNLLIAALLLCGFSG
jgi:hypothetical protein